LIGFLLSPSLLQVFISTPEGQLSDPFFCRFDKIKVTLSFSHPQ